MRTSLVWLAVVIAAVGAVASFPSGRVWLQSLIGLWQQDESSDATLAQVSSKAATYNRLGNTAELAGDNSTAISDFLLGEAAGPKYVWNFVALGAVYARLNRLAAAAAQLRQAVNLAPQTQFLHFNLASVELREGRYAAAFRDFNIETRISPMYQPAFDGRRQALEAPHAKARRIAAAQPTPIAVPSPSQMPAAARQPTATPAATGPASAPPSHPASRRLATPSAVPFSAPRQAIGLFPGRPAQTAPLSVSTSTAMEARTYLLDISQDLNFTQALPATDPSATTAQLNQELQALTRSPQGSEDEILRVGTAALLSGRLSLAATAFSAAAVRAPGDWRAPYLAGLAARASGDNQGARASFMEANARAARPEVYTSLAIVDLALGDDSAAAADAELAASVDPSYGPGRFTAGMVALVHKNAAEARRHLSAASNLSGVPARLGYFLSLVSPR